MSSKIVTHHILSYLTTETLVWWRYCYCVQAIFIFIPLFDVFKRIKPFRSWFQDVLCGRLLCCLQHAGLSTDILRPGALMPNISARRVGSASFKVGTFKEKKDRRIIKAFYSQLVSMSCLPLFHLDALCVSPCRCLFKTCCCAFICD